jgi:phosphotransacetylase
MLCGMPDDPKVRENRLRRMAERQGLNLCKSRRRDYRALDFGRWMIKDGDTDAVVAGATPRAYSLSIDDVEKYLTERGPELGRNMDGTEPVS